MSFPSINTESVGLTGLVWLLVSYGYVLYVASSLISEGSDLLLLIPSISDLVGSVILPLLGAVPDGAIMFFSGLGDISEAQETLSVGVGAIAGSTIMLLTVPLFLSILAGRVNLGPSGDALYFSKPKLKPDATNVESLMSSGVSISNIVKQNSVVMIISTIPYILVQTPAIYYAERTDNIVEAQRPYVLWGFVICIIGFVSYIVFQFKTAHEERCKLKKFAVMSKLVDKGKVSLEATLYTGKQAANTSGESNINENTLLVEQRKAFNNRSDRDYVNSYLRRTLLPTFKKCDKNGDGTLDFDEVTFMFRTLKMDLSKEEAVSVFKLIDEDNSGALSFDEIVKCASIFIQDSHTRTGSQNKDSPEENTDVEEETEDIPEDISNLPPDQQQAAILKKALINLGIGALLILIFSDPMVDIFQEVAVRANIPPFYVSFALAPLAANASEVLASYYFARKKTSKSITVSLSNLIGAASMNNTFCLSILLGLIYFRGLAWQYTAETLAIIFVQCVAFYLTTKKSLTLLDGIMMLSLFPLSLAFVYVLENILGLD